MNKKIIIWSIIYILLLSFELYISWVLKTIFSIISFIFYFFIIYIIIQTFKSIFNKENVIFNKEKIINFFKVFYYRVAIMIFLLFTIIWWFAYYQNDFNPAKIPIYEISDWEKKIVFITMSHIWTANFYEKVKEEIFNRKKDWYIYFFEWVKPWTKENHDKFNQALWIKLDEKTYENLAKIYWLTNQDNSLFLNLVNSKDKNIDLSLDEIIKLYEENWWFNNTKKNPPIDASREVISILWQMNERELRVFKYINKSFINALIKSENVQNSIQANFYDKKLFDIILHKRNKLLVDEIQKSEEKNIVITYWLLHFKWVLEELQKDNIKWQITKINYLYPLK